VASEELARRAAVAALRLRAQYRRPLHEPICPYDLALEMGLELRFVDGASLEGVYSADPPQAIVLNSRRPAGRRAYNCAHEIGHHVFGHGTRVDELPDGGSDPFDPIEYLADRFASALLMPRVAVARAFAVRRWSPDSCSDREMLTIASFFGVGYMTLLGYLEGTLGMLSGDRTIALRRSTPKSIRRQLLGTDVNAEIVIVDDQWGSRTVELEVGDLMILPAGADIGGRCIAEDTVGSVRIARATFQGKGAVQIGGAPALVRVSRRAYCGLGEFRHLEDPDEQ
jgi:hypothetical protein